MAKYLSSRTLDVWENSLAAVIPNGLPCHARKISSVFYSEYLFF
jgi:hypothetical protein